MNPAAPSIPHGEPGIGQVGHRAYVGGLWQEIGELQFDFLVRQGLQPHHYLLDIGCGALRGGVFFIPYLDAGHYFGIDKERALLEAGLHHEVGPELAARKRPRLWASPAFDFEAFGVRADFAIAQSLFTHLPPAPIGNCLEKLRSCVQPTGIFCATFFECDRPRQNPSEPHDHGYFAYTRDEMCDLGRRNGWTAEYVGRWNHPRDQRMMIYRPC
jgi:SAM-dependent methyltransferase